MTHQNTEGATDPQTKEENPHLFKITDNSLRDLVQRYKMDPDIWRKSQRGFPFNIPLNVIVMFSLVTPALVAILTWKITDQLLWSLFIPLIGVSVLAYFLTDSLIEQFKSSLQKAGLFGKDLNKAGVREDKPPV